MALACGQLDRCYPGDGWDKVAHRYLRIASDAAGKTVLGPALFSGLAGIGFVADFLSPNGSRYKSLLSAIDEALGDAIVAICDTLNTSHGCRVADMDVVSGAAGIALYFLSRHHLAAAQVPSRKLIGALAQISTRDSALPAWHTPSEKLTSAMHRSWPGGCLNCGLAHGITGVLATLSIARIQGLEMDSVPEAIHANAQWLLDQASYDEWGLNWPTAVPLLPRSSSEQGHFSRSAWCYGVPGIARALWLAGRAVGDAKYRDYAVQAWTGLTVRPRSAWGLYSVTFCHGLAGVLQIALRFAREVPNAPTSRLISELTGDILGAYQPESPFCYSDTLADGTKVEHPGILEGAAGVLLTLLSATSDAEPAWDRAFGIN